MTLSLQLHEIVAYLLDLSNRLFTENRFILGDWLEVVS
jgi:hypothetical protein